MKHIKFFEQANKIDSLYLVSIIDDNIDDVSHYAFYDEESRKNWTINMIYDDFEVDDSIEGIFDLEELIEFYNEGDNKIFLKDAELLTNVKLNPESQILKDAFKYNL